MSAILLSGLQGCGQRIHSLHIKLPPDYVSNETIDWCVENKCANFVKQDLLNCQIMAEKIDFRNTADDPIIKEDIGDKIINVTMSAWNWIF